MAIESLLPDGGCAAVVGGFFIAGGGGGGHLEVLGFLIL